MTLPASKMDYFINGLLLSSMILSSITWIMPAVSAQLILHQQQLHQQHQHQHQQHLEMNNRKEDRKSYRTKYGCDGSELKIVCEEGTLINLIRANYGRFSISICNDHGNLDWSVDCTSQNSYLVIANRCKSKQSCTIKVSSNLFTEDPCPGTHKYLEVQYRCIAKSIMNQSLHYVLESNPMSSSTRPPIVFPSSIPISPSSSPSPSSTIRLPPTSTTKISQKIINLSSSTTTIRPPIIVPLTQLYHGLTTTTSTSTSKTPAARIISSSTSQSHHHQVTQDNLIPRDKQRNSNERNENEPKLAMKESVVKKTFGDMMSGIQRMNDSSTITTTTLTSAKRLNSTTQTNVNVNVNGNSNDVNVISRGTHLQEPNARINNDVVNNNDDKNQRFVFHPQNSSSPKSMVQMNVNGKPTFSFNTETTTNYIISVPTSTSPSYPSQSSSSSSSSTTTPLISSSTNKPLMSSFFQSILFIIIIIASIILIITVMIYVWFHRNRLTFKSLRTATSSASTLDVNKIKDQHQIHQNSQSCDPSDSIFGNHKPHKINVNHIYGLGNQRKNQRRCEVSTVYHGIHGYQISPAPTMNGHIQERISSRNTIPDHIYECVDADCYFGYGTTTNININRRTANQNKYYCDAPTRMTRPPPLKAATLAPSFRDLNHRDQNLDLNLSEHNLRTIAPSTLNCVKSNQIKSNANMYSSRNVCASNEAIALTSSSSVNSSRNSSYCSSDSNTSNQSNCKATTTTFKSASNFNDKQQQQQQQQQQHKQINDINFQLFNNNYNCANF